MNIEEAKTLEIGQEVYYVSFFNLMIQKSSSRRFQELNGL
jgi:hypothetical protein